MPITPVKPAQEPKVCTVCGGTGLIPAGAWTTVNDADTCGRCGGTGVEPTIQPSQSSLFEDEGVGIGDEPNP